MDRGAWRATVHGVAKEEKGTTKDEMVGWHYRLDGREFG